MLNTTAVFKIKNDLTVCAQHVQAGNSRVHLWLLILLSYSSFLFATVMDSRANICSHDQFYEESSQVTVIMLDIDWLKRLTL